MHLSKKSDLLIISVYIKVFGILKAALLIDLKIAILTLRSGSWILNIKCVISSLRLELKSSFLTQKYLKEDAVV